MTLATKIIRLGHSGVMRPFGLPAEVTVFGGYSLIYGWNGTREIPTGKPSECWSSKGCPKLSRFSNRSPWRHHLYHRLNTFTRGQPPESPHRRSFKPYRHRTTMNQRQHPLASEHGHDNMARLGFRTGRSGAHASRTMMLNELESLLGALPTCATREDYVADVVDANLLGKGTAKTRVLTAKHLVELYGLDENLCLFRVFHHLWLQDAQARPVLALTLALARDPLLRLSRPFMLSKRPGEQIERKEIETVLDQAKPGRFSAASLKSFAQNINGSWTQAGFLQGRMRKVRALPTVTPTNLTFALFLGHLEGLRAQRLFASDWARLVSGSQDELFALAQSASRRGLLVFMNAGGAMEVRFPGYLTQKEEAWLHE